MAKKTKKQDLGPSRFSLIEKTFGSAFPEHAVNNHYFGSPRADEDFREQLGRATYVLYTLNNMFDRADGIRAAAEHFRRLLQGFFDQTPLEDGTTLTQEDLTDAFKYLERIITSLPTPPTP